MSRKPSVEAAEICEKGSCAMCTADAEFLTRKRRPRAPKTRGSLRVADLFAGCGGMSLGLHEAARRAGRRLVVALAADLDARALGVLVANLPGARIRQSDVAALFPGKPGSPLTKAERKLRKTVGRIDILIGGPPCQGHSDLNNHTRRKDPKNALYLRMARAAEVLEPRAVVIENVVAVQRDSGRVVEKTNAALKGAGYAVACEVVDLVRVGVPQRRRRHILLASRIDGLDPTRVLAGLEAAMPGHAARTVRWAIGDLRGLHSKNTYDSASGATEESARRIKYLFDRDIFDLPDHQRPACHRNGGHSYVSVYGRLRSDQPAQTITTGFGSMGQGRYVHPSQRRTITPHEAARLQTFPDWFRFGKNEPRTALASMIGNAVPPLLMVALGASIVPWIYAVPKRNPRRPSSPPRASSPEALRRMQVVRRRDTAAEVAVRRLLHAQGLRYRVDRPILAHARRRADLVFTAARVAVFVDGCFWHSCPAHRSRPKSNAAWWAAKLAENRRRDRSTDRQLSVAGWRVVRVWEHEVPTTAAARIARTVRARLGHGKRTRT